VFWESTVPCRPYLPVDFFLPSDFLPPALRARRRPVGSGSGCNLTLPATYPYGSYLCCMSYRFGAVLGLYDSLTIFTSLPSFSLVPSYFACLMLAEGGEKKKCFEHFQKPRSFSWGAEIRFLSRWEGGEGFPFRGSFYLHPGPGPKTDPPQKTFRAIGAPKAWPFGPGWTGGLGKKRELQGILGEAKKKTENGKKNTAFFFFFFFFPGGKGKTGRGGGAGTFYGHGRFGGAGEGTSGKTRKNKKNAGWGGGGGETNRGGLIRGPPHTGRRRKKKKENSRGPPGSIVAWTFSRGAFFFPQKPPHHYSPGRFKKGKGFFGEREKNGGGPGHETCLGLPTVTFSARGGGGDTRN